MDLVYRKFKRRRAGPCNICGEVGSLTWDHVPPKGGIELEPVEIDRAAAAYVSSLASEKPEVSHDSLRFRTICAKCNSLLGATYDPALNELARTVGRFLRTPLTLPAVVQVETRPTAVVRAVLGHLLAARLSSEDGFFDPDIRGLVLDPLERFRTRFTFTTGSIRTASRSSCAMHVCLRSEDATRTSSDSAFSSTFRSRTSQQPLRFTRDSTP